MATTGTADNNQSVIVRGTPSDANVTTLVPGGKITPNLHTNANFIDGAVVADDSTLPRDTDSPLGNRITQKPINSQLSYSWERNPGASGIGIDGQYITGAGPNARSVTFSTDEAANDNRADAGQFWIMRSGQVSADSYDLPTG